MRSPDAVLELSAYQDACPQPGAALACAEPSSAKALTAAAAKIERRIVFKTGWSPSKIPARLVQRAKAEPKKAKKWAFRSRNISVCNIRD